MGAKFLSLTGLTQYDTKIKEYISTAVTENSPIIVGDAEYSAVLKGETTVAGVTYKNEALNEGCVSLGANSKAGLKGYYFTHINFTTKQISLHNKQFTFKTTSGGWKTHPVSDENRCGWAKGDVISFVCNGHYDNSATIVNVVDNVITVDNIPFTSTDVPTTISSSLGALIGVNINNKFDECSVFCVKKFNIGSVELGGNAFAIGTNTHASNAVAYAEGYNTVAYGKYSHAEGNETEAGYTAHSEGYLTKATGHRSHAEGQETQSIGDRSHAEGKETIANGNNSHAEGYKTTANGGASHAEGSSTEAGENAHSEGLKTKATGGNSHAEGESTEATNYNAHSEGKLTVASGDTAHAEGHSTQAIGKNSHSEGKETIANGEQAHAEGTNTTAHKFAHAEGWTTTASGESSHSEGSTTVASGHTSHAEGYLTKAIGDISHAEGSNTIAEGDAAHAEGYLTKAIGNNSHAQNYKTQALGIESHAEGSNTIAEGATSHAEGYLTKAIGENSHVEGEHNTANGVSSHAEGCYTKTHNKAEHASGVYNNSIKSADPSDATHFSIGVGNTDTNRKNAFEVKQNGDIYITGIGNFTGDNSDESTNLADTINNLDKKVNTGGQITSNIQIAGGPLANDILDTDYWPEDWYETPGDKTTVRIIPANTSFEDIIRTLFLQELPGKVSWTTPEWSPSVDQPSVTLSESGSLEVGTRITIKNTTAGIVSDNSRSSTCSASYGYFLADAEGKPTGSHINNKTLTKTKTGGSNNTVSYTYTWNGSSVNAGDEMQVKENTNTLKVSQSGPTVYVEALPTTKVFASTNTKKVLDKVHATLTDTKPSDQLLSNSKDYTITGVRYAFTGAVASGFVYDSTYIRDNLGKNGYGKSSLTSLKAPAGNTQVIIAFPSTWGSLTKVIDNNSLYAIITNEFKLTDNIPVYGNNGFAPVNYKVYVYTSKVVLGDIDYTISIN